MSLSIKRKVASLTFAQGVTVILNVVLGMVFARTLTQGDYATYIQAFVSIDFITPLLTLGLPYALFYLVPNSKNQKQLVYEATVILVFSGLLFAIFILLGGNVLLSKRFANPDLSNALLWTAFYPIYTFPILVNNILIIKNRSDVNVKYIFTSNLILSILLLFSIIIWKDYQHPLMIRIFFPLLVFPFAIFYTFKYLDGCINFKINKSTLFDHIKYAIPIGLASLIGTITLQMDSIIVSFICKPDQFAIYSIGAREIPLISIITGSISVVVMSEMSSFIKDGKIDFALAIFKKASFYSSAILIPIMVFLLMNSEKFIEVMYTNKYINSALPFSVYLFILPVRIVYYGPAFIAFGKNKQILYRSIVELGLNAILTYLFVKQWGIIGAAIATIVTLYVWSIPFNISKLSGEFKVKPFKLLPIKAFFKIFLISLLSGLTVFPIRLLGMNLVLEFTIAFVLFVLVYFMCLMMVYSQIRRTLFNRINRILNL